MHPNCKLNKNLPDGAIIIYSPGSMKCKTLTIGKEYEFKRFNHYMFTIVNDKGQTQFYNDDNFGRKFKIKDMGKVYTVQKIQKVVDEMTHWQNVVYLPLNADATILDAEYIDDENKVEINFVINRNGNPENKKLKFSESRFAEIIQDFKYEDSIQTVKTEIMKPKLKKPVVPSTFGSDDYDDENGDPDFELLPEEVEVLKKHRGTVLSDGEIESINKLPLTEKTKSEIIKVNNFNKEIDKMDKPQTVFQDLYAHLFNTITLLKEGKITSEVAKSTAVVSQTVINLARLELEYKLNEVDKPQMIEA